jgi:hypothetical protein
MSLRQLKQKIIRQENDVRRKTNNPTFKDYELRRRFNVLAGGESYGSYCTYERPPTTQLHTEHWDDEHEAAYFCHEEKAGEECVRDIVTPEDRKNGIEKNSACAMTDATGNCPSKCRPLR